MNISDLTSLALKLSGAVFVLSALLDFIVLLIPPQLDNAAWRVGYISSVVDRGIVPLVGMAFILVAYWIDASSGAAAKPSKFNLKLPTFLLASLLGLMFLVFIPLQLSNLNQVKQTALEQIQQSVEQGGQQIQGFLQQINALSQNPQLLDQAIQQRTAAIETGQVQGRQLTNEQITSVRQQRDQLQQLRDISKKPQEFKKRIGEIKNRLQTQLQEQQRTAENLANTRTLTQGLRIGLNSLMLAIAYATIGWFGLRGLGSTQGSRPTAPKR
jgi:uncharacterized protein YoxC